MLNGTNPLGAFYGSTTFTNLVDRPGRRRLHAAGHRPEHGHDAGAVTTNPFTITAGPATHLIFTASGEPPLTATAGQNLAPAQADRRRRRGPVRLHRPHLQRPGHDRPGQQCQTGTIVGTLTVNAVNGVATFNDVEIDSVGTYNLQATSGSLTLGTSTSITISPGAPAKLVWESEPPSQRHHGLPLRREA